MRKRDGANMNELILGIVGVVLGGLITWAVAHFYYKRAGDELRTEAAELRKLGSMTLTAMEYQGLTKLNRDSNGKIVGFVFEHVGTGGMKFGGSAKVESVSAKLSSDPASTDSA